MTNMDFIALRSYPDFLGKPNFGDKLDFGDKRRLLISIGDCYEE